MHLLGLLIYLPVAIFAIEQSTQGILDLVKRRLPNHVDDLSFRLTGNQTVPVISFTNAKNDKYFVSSTEEGKIFVEGNSPIALASGLHRYLTDTVHVDIFWFIGSRLDVGPLELPPLDLPIIGSSIVPWRYHFNTVTFSYTSAFWTWEDWELELDWLALRGVNLPLAWVGQEKILIDTFREIGLTDADINTYLSGPAFQAWNRFGNIQGSWGGDLPMEWIDDQFELQKNITKRMIELGMTPVLPCFTGFVPQAITRILSNATVVNGSRWEDFPTKYTNVTFLEPSDPTFEVLQKSFISKQAEALGNITHIYTLDQYNENDPFSGELEYLSNVSYNTWRSLKAADPHSVWLAQGWLFVSNIKFWTDDRVEAYLGGVKDNGDMLVLDLFSESQPQWQRTNSYFGKPWIWCQLHNYGGNMGLYGQVMNLTINPIEALANSSSLVGFGLTMEGQEGNEIVYDLLLDQAWSGSPIDTDVYFHNWVTRRYAGDAAIPQELYIAWDLMRTTVYNNTNSSTQAVTKSIFELSPKTTGLLGRVGHHPTTVNYEPLILIKAWNLMFEAATDIPSLWDNPAYAFDMVDVTRQALSNSFNTMYTNLVNHYNSSSASNVTISAIGKNLTSLLITLDSVLSTNPSFSLSTWINAARSLTKKSTVADFYEYNARNQITIWGPNGEINDYASKSWGGLVKEYYVPRWEIFTQYLLDVDAESYNETDLRARLKKFESGWQNGNSSADFKSQDQRGSLSSLLEELNATGSNILGGN